jgi:hypothetical protein
MSTEPEIEEPSDLLSTDETKKWKVKLWEQVVDRYGSHLATLTGNKEALYALIIESLSPTVKSKLRSKKGFSKAKEQDNHRIWLLTQLEDIMVRFEKVNPKLLTVDNNQRMHRIMNLKQGEATNEDFVKLVVKELKVYEKHGGIFVCGGGQKSDLKTRIVFHLRILVQFYICCLTPMEWAGVCLSIYMNSKFQNFDFSFFSFFWA